MINTELNKYKIHFSKLTGKLEGFQSISGDTTVNSFCYDNYIKGKAKNKKAGKVIDICGVCYSQNMLETFRKNMKPSLAKNEILSELIIPIEYLPSLLLSHLRINAHGEVMDSKIDYETKKVIKTYPKFNYITNIVNIALKNPHCKIVMWTKRTDIIIPFFNNPDNIKPSNLILIYSNKKTNHILKTPPKHFDRTFNNVEESKYVDSQNCTGQKCKDCMLCYTHVKDNSVNTIVEKIKSYGKK